MRTIHSSQFVGLLRVVAERADALAEAEANAAFQKGLLRSACVAARNEYTLREIEAAARVSNVTIHNWTKR